jgi:thiamine biosynthesis protein ThiC
MFYSKIAAHAADLAKGHSGAQLPRQRHYQSPVDAEIYSKRSC